jgi:hypothetical protein
MIKIHPLDGMMERGGAVFEAKFMPPRLFSDEGAAEKYMTRSPSTTCG